MTVRDLNELTKVAIDIESLCSSCSSKDSKECGLCESHLQARFDDLDLGR